jgi:hypothetical protein
MMLEGMFYRPSLGLPVARFSALIWFGLVWFGLVWFGLVWFGHYNVVYKNSSASPILSPNLLNNCLGLKR